MTYKASINSNEEDQGFAALGGSQKVTVVVYITSPGSPQRGQLDEDDPSSLYEPPRVTLNVTDESALQSSLVESALRS